MSRTAKMEQLRATLRAFCPTGADREAVTVSALAAVMGVQTDERQTLRKRIRDMLQRGELRRVKTGWFVRVPHNEPGRFGESPGRIWRAVHVQAAPFTARKISQISRCSVATVGHYLSWLAQDGYVEFAGYENRSRRYSVTPKGKFFREIPYPPSLFVDPTEAERVACWRLMQLYHEDVTAPAVVKQIRENLATLNARFNGRKQENTNVEQGN